MIEASAGKHSVTTGRTAWRTASANVDHCPRRSASTSSRCVIGSGGVAVMPRRPPSGSQPEIERDQQLEHQAEPERGQRHARHGHHARPVIDPAVLVDGRQHPERDADHDGQQQREGHQLEGVREVARQVVADRVAAAQRLAEIAGGQALEIAHELDAERSVEAVPGADRLDHRLTRVRAGGQAGGIAGDQVRDGERQTEQPEEHQAQEGQPTEQVLRQRRMRPHFVTIASG